jgi:hypothetical protein
MRRIIKSVVRKSAEGYAAYPLGLRGVVVSDCCAFEEGLKNIKPGIQEQYARGCSCTGEHLWG